MVKAIMTAGFVAACGFMGALKARELKERIALLEDFRRMIIFLQGYSELYLKLQDIGLELRNILKIEMSIQVEKKTIVLW